MASNDKDSNEDSSEYYGVRDGTLFLIDTTSAMFENNSSGISYFQQCMQQYIQILRQKLVWNKQDWMGLILFGTEKWDTDPEVKNVLTQQKLSLISVDKLKEAMKIDESEWEYYKSISASKHYPLHDVLWHASQAFYSIKIVMPVRRVVLLTCHDNPPNTSEAEKHRIRAKVAAYSDIGLRLFVVGLGEHWNHDSFYKDLEMLSGKINKEDYKRLSLMDLMQQVKRASKHMAKVPWRLGENITLSVIISKVCVKSQYLKKVRISREDNVPLVAYTSFQQTNTDMEDEMKEDEYEEFENITLPIKPTNIRYVQSFGQRNIYFTSEEVKNLSNIRKPGIDSIAVKPLHCDPLYHIESPYFVSYDKNYSNEEKLLFGSILQKCELRKLTIVCAVTIRKNSTTFLYNMIPNWSAGGFYLHKIPFKEYVRNLEEYLGSYIYDNNTNKPPIDEKAVTLFEEFIQNSTSDYTSEDFPNPKLCAQLQSVETLALDLEKQQLSGDEIVADSVKIKEQEKIIKELIDVCLEMEGAPEDPLPKKRKENAKEKVTVPSKERVSLLAQSSELDVLTVAQLRAHLKLIGVESSGKKAVLLQRIRDYYAEHADML